LTLVQCDSPNSMLFRRIASPDNDKNNHHIPFPSHAVPLSRLPRYRQYRTRLSVGCFSRSRICARGINPGIAEAASAHSLVALLDSWSGARSKGRIVEDRSGVFVGFIHARRRSMVCLVLVVDSGVTKRCLRDRPRTPSSMKGMTMMVGRICQIEKGLTRRMIQVSCNPAGRKTCISG